MACTEVARPQRISKIFCIKILFGSNLTNRLVGLGDVAVMSLTDVVKQFLIGQIT